MEELAKETRESNNAVGPPACELEGGHVPTHKDWPSLNRIWAGFVAFLR